MSGGANSGLKRRGAALEGQDGQGAERLPPEGRVPPQALDLEAAVLGACLVDGAALAEVAPLLSPEVFYRRRHADIYEAILRADGAGGAVDLYTVAQELRKANLLEGVGGAKYLAELTLRVGSGANAPAHARVLVEKYALRRLVEAGYRIAELGFGAGGDDVSDALAQADALVADVNAALTGRADEPSPTQLMQEEAEDLRLRVARAREGKINGVSTGLADLNRITGGWQPGHLVILAARTAMGKTWLMLHFAKAAAKSGVPAAIFSLEMSAMEISRRLVLSETDIPPDRYRSGYLSNVELEKAAVANHSASVLPITVHAARIHRRPPCVSMGQIRAKARTLQRRGKCGILLIDYLQLCRAGGEKGRNREQDVAQMSREAKLMALELGIPVILLSQLSREIEKRGSKRPMLSDLRESGAIEQDANLVIFIHRPAYYGDGDESSGELIIAKNRDGATGTVAFRYGAGMTSIFDAPKPGQDTPPPPTGVQGWVNYYEPADREAF